MIEIRRLPCPSLRADIEASVRFEYAESGIVDVSPLAELIRKRHLEANIAREDVEHLVIEVCRSLSAPMLLFSLVEEELAVIDIGQPLARIS